MGSIHDLASVNLTIPAWQMAVYICLIALLMLARKTRLCLFTTFVFGLYWGYFLSGWDFLTAAGNDTGVQAAYIVFGLGLAAFSLMALFYEER